MGGHDLSLAAQLAEKDARIAELEKERDEARLLYTQAEERFALEVTKNDQLCARIAELEKEAARLRAWIVDMKESSEIALRGKAKEHRSAEELELGGMRGLAELAGGEGEG